MTIEIVVDGPKNQDVQFRPLQRALRGTFDVNRVPDPQARLKIAEFPRPIPGVHITLDTDKKTAAIVEPLYEAEHAAIREKIERMGMKLPPQREEFQNIDVPTWLYWMRRAVANGVAKIVEGKFPEIDESQVQKNFITKPLRDPRDNLIGRLVAVLYASLPPKQREEAVALIGSDPWA
jgi:hypothetical protein